MQAGQQMDVSRHQPDFQDRRALLTGHVPQEPAQKPGERRIDSRRTVPGRPHDVHVDAVPHGSPYGIMLGARSPENPAWGPDYASLDLAGTAETLRQQPSRG